MLPEIRRTGFSTGTGSAGRDSVGLGKSGTLSDGGFA